MATAISAKTTAKIPIAIIPANGIGGMAPAIELPAAPDVSAELPEDENFSDTDAVPPISTVIKPTKTDFQ